MNHSFNIEVAKEYGVDEAILIENIYFWIAKNKANKKHFYDGEYWTYNSTKALSELFPYWTERQVDRIVTSVKNKGAVLIGNYNKLGYDRTRWFSLTSAVTDILRFGEMQIPKTLNGNTENVGTIPDINPNINTDKDIVPVKEIIDYLNLKANTKYRHTGEATKKIINARFNDKFTLDDFKTVIDKKAKEWIGTSQELYLRPETLFGNKFEGYLNQKIKATDTKSKFTVV